MAEPAPWSSHECAASTTEASRVARRSIAMSAYETDRFAANEHHSGGVATERYTQPSIPRPRGARVKAAHVHS